MEKNVEQLKALITLLEDPSEDIYRMVSSSILEQGTTVIPELEKAWENSMDQFYQERIETLIKKIHKSNTLKELKIWIKSDYEDLLEGAWLIARFQFPDLTYDEVNEPLEKIKKDVWLELNDNLTALEKIKVINHIFFEIHGFSINTFNLYNPKSLFINQVIERKKGNPISIAILYLVIAQKMGLPVFGMNLPGNLILGYRDDQGLIDRYDDQRDNTLFYINPFNKGTISGRKEIEYYLLRQRLEFQESHFLPCTNLVIINRYINNLINAYEHLGYYDKIFLFKEVLQLFPGE
jgi:regulator of sirC expression with transglutaminase-like and TPR domain